MNLVILAAPKDLFRRFDFAQRDYSQAQGFAVNAKGDEKKEFENKHSDKAVRYEQEKKTADLSRAHTCRM